MTPVRFLWIFVLSLALWAAAVQGEAVAGDDKAATVEAARKDLAQRLMVPEASIEQVGPVEEVTWPDASLGCPEPGMIYAQVLTPGYRFKLQGGGQVYTYHSGGNVLRLCAR